MVQFFEYENVKQTPLLYTFQSENEKILYTNLIG
jgi:hypothetical protein